TIAGLRASDCEPVEAKRAPRRRQRIEAAAAAHECRKALGNLCEFERAQLTHIFAEQQVRKNFVLRQRRRAGERNNWSGCVPGHRKLGSEAARGVRRYEIDRRVEAAVQRASIESDLARRDVECLAGEL